MASVCVNDYELKLNFIKESFKYFSDEWLFQNKILLETEHIHRFISIGLELIFNKTIHYHLEGNFKTKIDLNSEVLQTINILFNIDRLSITPVLLKRFVTAFEQIDVKDVLILTGQQLSSTSIRTLDALPPNKILLINACFKPFNNQLSQAVKQWEKHVGRPGDIFWPKRKGSIKEKEKSVRELIYFFLSNIVWWNTYIHYQHDCVFELRIESGHGMRWKNNGNDFIGFLEPFIEYKV